jgi:hypothetical protein
MLYNVQVEKLTFDSKDAVSQEPTSCTELSIRASVETHPLQIWISTFRIATFATEKGPRDLFSILLVLGRNLTFECTRK